MTHTNDLTEGKVSCVFLSFFFPMLLTNQFQQIYTFVDAVIVGKGIGDNALAAVGNMSAITLLIVGFAQGITSGFSVVVAQYFGSREIRVLQKSIAISIKLSFMLSLMLTASSLFFLKTILSIMRTDTVIFKESLAYGYIISSGLIVTMAYNLCASILRALGDSKTPFLAIVISALLNVFLDSVFIFVYKMGVGGAAIATVLAQLVSVVICMFRLRKLESMQLIREDFKGDIPLSMELLKNGIPTACMNSITAIGCMMVQSYVNGLGVVYMSAYSACNKYLNLFMLPPVTVGFAVSAFTSQNYGAKNIIV